MYLEHTGTRVPGRPEDPAHRCDPGRLRVLERPARPGLPARVRHLRPARHRRQRDGDGLRKPRRPLRHRCLLQPQPRDRGARPLRRVPARRAGRRRRRRHAHADADRSACASRSPIAYASSIGPSSELERHYRDMQDVEFTIEHERLYLLQTRGAKRTAAAALASAVAFVEEGLIDRRAAVRRIEAASLDQLLHPTIDPEAGSPSSRPGSQPRREPRAAPRSSTPTWRPSGREGRRGRHPRPAGDHARRHPWPDHLERRPDRTRGHDLARCRRRTGTRQAVRRRLRSARDRPRDAHRDRIGRSIPSRRRPDHRSTAPPAT